ncbi:1555_t:CDS:1 [Dentiscutata erythropus]|uniref:1555_t:CDS:1 n=1 Tax=Dentiscutata erythropus TaxID=1348616 RepID=A0A9N9GN55_9GLOM|nr:1555_t:CDS:1 [Dentiscutata erythropus]
MSFYCFETRQDRTLAPYPPPECSQQLDRMSPSEIVDHIIATNIDPSTLLKIENQIAVPLRQLISPRENRRRRCIPRPQNNFVLYRRNFHAVITKERGHAVAKNFKLISNEAAKNWSEESNEVKQLYELIADCAKKVHDCTYPQYVYQPKHKSSKKGNNTIFREVTMDTCKQRSEKSKSDRNSKAEKSQPSKPAKSSSKSAAASMTLTMTTISSLSLDTSTSKSDSSITSSFKSLPQSERETSIKDYPQQHLIKEWRWAHYGQTDARSVHNDQYKIPPPQSPKPMQGVEKIPLITTHLPQSNATSLLPPPPLDIPISSNFTGYDKNVWSLVNGLTTL